jgi:hypothetical protein
MLTLAGPFLFIFFLDSTKEKQGVGVSHCGLAIYIKMYLKAKKRIMETQNISTCKNIIFKKIL